MWNFFTSDVGKVALGGLIAFAGQLVTSVLGWIKEVRFAEKTKREKAEYLAMRLVLAFDVFVKDCSIAVNDPLTSDEAGVTERTEPDPKLKLPKGDYKALPRRLMYQVLSMPNKVDSVEEGLSFAMDISGMPDFTEYFEYRGENWSKLGLDALELIDLLCDEFEIPPPEHAEHYAPKQSFIDEMAKIEAAQKKRHTLGADIFE